MATIVDGKMRSGELKDNDQVVVDVEAAGEGVFAKKSEVDTEIQRIDTALTNKQDELTFDNTPTEGSSNPVTSDGIKQAIDAATPEDYNEVKSQVQQNAQDITGIEAKIPAQASAQNQLADKAFVNSSIQTNTATFRGTYNLVTDLGLTVSATEQQTAEAIATHLASLVPPVVPENNDYVFVQIPRETSDPTVVVRYDRYKCSVTEAGGVVTRTWSFEFSLNNSSFTADQWAAINSGITSGDVAKIQLIDALVGRGYIGFQNGGNKVLAISGEQLTVYKTVSRRATDPATSYPNKIGFKFNLKDFVAYCLSAINDPIGKSTIDQVQLNGSAKLKLYFPSTTTADFVRIGVYTSATATTPVSVSEAQLIGSLGTITEYTFEFSSQQYLTADATYYFRIEDDSGTAIPCYIYASDKFTGFSWAFINSDGTAGSDISSTMPDLQLGCNIKTYYTIELEAKDLVALENFSQQKTYAQGERIVYNNDLYEVKAGGHAAGAWNGNHFKKLFSIGSNLTMGDAKVEKRATSSVWPSPSGNIVAGQNGATASGTNNIVLGYGAEARNRNASSLTDTTMDNIALGNAARIINDLLASARKPTTDATAVADAVYFGYGAKYSSATTYAYQSYCSYGYGVYQCTSAISSPEVWNAAHWSLKDALDYDATKTYAVGDVCKHSGSLYTCSTAIDTPKDWDVDNWTYASLGEFQDGAMVSLTTSAGSTLPQNDYLQIYIAPAGYMTGISRAILLGAFSVIRASGGIGIGNELTVNDPDATVIGNGATSHGAKSLNFAATELIKVFLGDANLVDLINQAVADQMIKAAVSAEVMQTRSTPTATRKLLALNPANPTGEKTEVTAQDIGALGKTGDQTLAGSLKVQADSIPGFFSKLVTDGLSVSQGEDGSAKYSATAIIVTQFGMKTFSFPATSGTLALLENIAPAFSTSATYEVNKLCVYANSLYRCTTAITTAGAWDSSKWTAATVQDVLAAIWTALGEIPSWAKSATKPSYTLNEVCPDLENWLGVPNTTAAGKSIKILAKTVNGVIEGGVIVTGSSNNDNNLTKYRYGGVTVMRNGVATVYLWDTTSDSGIVRRSELNDKAPLESPAFTGTPTAPNLTDQSADGQVANKKYVDDKVAGVPLRYDMPTAVALVADNDEATLVCADRAVTNATIAAGFSTLNLTFPTAVTSKVRDFYLRIIVAAGESAPALSIPQGITIENSDGAVPEIADGETSAASTTLVWFSETAPNIFTAKAETVKAVA